MDTAVRQNETEALIGYMQSLNKAYKNSKNQVMDVRFLLTAWRSVWLKEIVDELPGYQGVPGA